MSQDLNRSRRSILRNFWKNELEVKAKYVLDQMTLMLHEHEEIMCQLHRSSTNRTQKIRYFNWEHELGHDRLFHDYFSDEPLFPDDVFRR